MGIQGGETVACHMYRMALMASLLTPPTLDKTRCIEMALVHDLAEAIVGDITPDCGVSREEKRRREEQAMSCIIASLGETSPQARRVRELWNEYEEDKTEEADFVHQLDKLELALQASEYEQKYAARNLGVFKDSANPRITDSRLRLIMDQLF